MELRSHAADVPAAELIVICDLLESSPSTITALADRTGYAQSRVPSDFQATVDGYFEWLVAQMGACILSLYRSSAQPTMARLGADLPCAAARPGWQFWPPTTHSSVPTSSVVAAHDARVRACKPWRGSVIGG